MKKSEADKRSSLRSMVVFMWQVRKVETDIFKINSDIVF